MSNDLFFGEEKVLKVRFDPPTQGIPDEAMVGYSVVESYAIFTDLYRCLASERFRLTEDDVVRVIKKAGVTIRLGLTRAEKRLCSNLIRVNTQGKQK